MILDKHNTMDNLNNRNQVILDLGCGPRKRNKNWIGIDLLDYEGVDIVGDVYEIIGKFPPDSVDEVHSYHFFEHIPDVALLLKELQRVLKEGGLIEIVVPHFSNPYYYSDYTHKNFFGLYSLSYLVSDNIFKRKVPQYQRQLDLKLESVYLRFTSPFGITRLIRFFYQLVFNSFNIMKEIYEDSWSNTFSCFEIKYILRK